MVPVVGSGNKKGSLPVSRQAPSSQCICRCGRMFVLLRVWACGSVVVLLEELPPVVFLGGLGVSFLFGAAGLLGGLALALGGASGGPVEFHRTDFVGGVVVFVGLFDDDFASVPPGVVEGP